MGQTSPMVSFIIGRDKDPFGRAGADPVPALFLRRVILKLMSPNPTWSDGSNVSSCLKVWTYSLVKSSGLRHLNALIKMQIHSAHSCPSCFPLVVIYFLSLLRMFDNNEACTTPWCIPGPVVCTNTPASALLSPTEYIQSVPDTWWDRNWQTGSMVSSWII